MILVGIVVLVLGVLYAPTVAQSTVTHDTLCEWGLVAQIQAPVPMPKCTFSITGNITAADVSAFERAVELAKSKGFDLQNVPVILDTGGGSMSAAFAIGRTLRREKMKAYVYSDAKCFSACVLLLAGAVDRHVYGPVGIHRPFSSDTFETKDQATAQRAYGALANETRTFLKEMNLPDFLFDAMLRVRPEEMKILTPEELKNYGLAQSDPVFDEMEAARMANQLGISKMEYHRRRATGWKCSELKTPEAVQKCHDDVWRK